MTMLTGPTTCFDLAGDRKFYVLDGKVDSDAMNWKTMLQIGLNITGTLVLLTYFAMKFDLFVG